MSSAEWIEGDGPHLEWRISALLDGELTTREENLARAHLARCDRCQQEFAEVAVARAALRELGEVEPPEGFYDRIEARLRRPRLGAWVLLTVGFGLLVAVCMALALPTPSVRVDVGEVVEVHEDWSARVSGVAEAGQRDAARRMLPGTLAGRRISALGRWSSAWYGRYGGEPEALSLLAWRGSLRRPDGEVWARAETRGVSVFVADGPSGEPVYVAQRGGTVYALVGEADRDEAVRGLASLPESEQIGWTERIELNLRSLLRRLGF
ncbi:MAG: hypothetical protein KatS3mg008_1037 [Acidimicrobiales bacterium]|nr:MAG: hypothetical protein KatS3mg008_1037 [Acidimicrobiales bacterium]